MWKDYQASSIHPDGHKTILCEEEWWFYPSGYAGPRKPGPQPAGPFKTNEEAKKVLETGQLPPPRLLEIPNA